IPLYKGPSNVLDGRPDAFIWMPDPHGLSGSTYAGQTIVIKSGGSNIGFDQAPIGTRRRVYFGCPVQIQGSINPSVNPYNVNYIETPSPLNLTVGPVDYVEFVSLGSFDGGTTGAWRVDFVSRYWDDKPIDGETKGLSIRTTDKTSLFVGCEQAILRDAG